MSLRQGMPVGSGLVFREDFYNSMAVMDQEGIITGAPIVDRRLEASALNTGMVQYGGNARGLLRGATQATWALRFKTGADVVSDNVPLSRYTNAAGGSFYFDIYNNQLDFAMVNSATGANRLYRLAGVTANTEYDLTVTYNGSTLAVLAYLAGLPTTFTAIVGTTPASLSTTFAGPLEVFALNAVKYSTVGLIMRSIKVFDFAMTAEEAKDLYEQDSMQEISP